MPEKYFEVRTALQQAGRTDLIGNDCDALITDRPPKEAIARRRSEANEKLRGEYGHTIATGGHDDSAPDGSKQKRSRHTSRNGYRPKRKQLRKDVALRRNFGSLQIPVIARLDLPHGHARTNAA